MTDRRVAARSAGPRPTISRMKSSGSSAASARRLVGCVAPRRGVLHAAQRLGGAAQAPAADLLAEHGQRLEQRRRGRAPGRPPRARSCTGPSAVQPARLREGAQRGLDASPRSTRAAGRRAPRAAPAAPWPTSAGVRPFGHHAAQRVRVVGDLAHEEEATRSRRSPPACRRARGRAAAPARRYASESRWPRRRPMQLRRSTAGAGSGRSARSASRGRRRARPARSARARRPATNSSSVNSSRLVGHREAHQGEEVERAPPGR